MQNLLLIIVSVFLSAGGQVVLKYGAMKSLNKDGLAGFLNVYSMSGLALYGLSAVFWMLVLRKVDLSYAYPMVALGYVVVIVASYYFFGESISMLKIIGLSCILVGIIVISRS